VVVLAVTSGFEHEFQDKVLAINAHLIVTSYGLERDMAEAEQDAEVIKKRLASLPGWSACPPSASPPAKS